MLKFLILFLYPFAIYCESSIHVEWRTAYNQAVKGSVKLNKIEKPFVTIFGGGGVQETDPYYEMAYNLSQSLAKQGCAIITGGNLGIMKAANCGAASVKEQGITSIAIDWKHVARPNTCAEKRLTADHHFARKWLLMHYSSAFVVFPGGVGTLDELSELIVLFSTSQQAKVPFFVIGTTYWKDIQEWLTVGLNKKLITQEAYDLITFTDDLSIVEQTIINFLRNK